MVSLIVRRQEVGFYGYILNLSQFSILCMVACQLKKMNYFFNNSIWFTEQRHGQG